MLSLKDVTAATFKIMTIRNGSGLYIPNERFACRTVGSCMILNYNVAGNLFTRYRSVYSTKHTEKFQKPCKRIPTVGGKEAMHIIGYFHRHFLSYFSPNFFLRFYLFI